MRQFRAMTWQLLPIFCLAACVFDEGGVSLNVDLSQSAEDLSVDRDHKDLFDTSDSSVDGSDAGPGLDGANDIAAPDLPPTDALLDVPPPDIDPDAPAADGGADSQGADSQPVTGPFSTPVPLTALNAPESDDDPSLTADMLEIFFDSARPGGKGAGDIWTATRASVSSAWSAPTPVTILNTAEGETTPEVSADGLAIYFASTRSGGLGSNDIYVATRASRTVSWSAPALVSELSSTSGDFAPTVSADHVFMVMSSNRPGVGNYDLYSVSRATPTDTWSAPVLLAELNTPQVETDPWSNDARTILYFTTDRPGGLGDWDIWRATRSTPGDAFGAPSPVTELNSAANDSDIWLSPDMSVAYLSSNRDGDTDLFIATR